MTTRRSSRGLRVMATLATGAIVATACGSDDATSAPATADAPVAEAANDAPVETSLLNGVVPTVTGSQVDLASLADQDVLLWVWAPW